MCAGGCIMIPIPHEERAVDGSRKSVATAAPSVLNAPGSTRAQVLLSLGEPDLYWDDARVIVYRWTTSNLAILFAAGGGYAGSAAIEEVPTSRFLLCEFDVEGRVRRWEQRRAPLMDDAPSYARKIWRTW